MSAGPKTSRRHRSNNNGNKSRKKSSRTRALANGFESLESRNLLTTFNVINLNDSGPGSLRDAINQANTTAGADTIQFAGGLSGTINLASTLNITDDVAINGPGANNLTVSGDDGVADNVRVFAVLPASVVGATDTVPSAAEVATAPDVKIRGLTIADGLATDALGFDPTDPTNPGYALGGGLYNLGGTVLLKRVRVEDNVAAGVATAGGAVANEFGGTLIVQQSEFKNNTSAGFFIGAGGAITSDLGVTTDGLTGQPNVNIKRSSFVGNTAVAQAGYNAAIPFSGAGGGGAILNVTGNLTVEGSSFRDNLAQGGYGSAGSTSGGVGFGGAILSQDVSPLGIAESTVVITGTTFANNTARGGNADPGVNGGQASGGAVAVKDGGEGRLRNNKFRGNDAQGGNGGDGANGGVGTGGGVAASSGAELSLKGNLFLRNSANGGLGGAGGLGASGRGGGLGLEIVDVAGYTPDPATATVESDTYKKNAALGGFGGGIFNDGDLTIAHSQLVKNKAIGESDAFVGFVPGYQFQGVGFGGGIFSVGPIDIEKSELLGNKALGSDGAQGTNLTLVPLGTVPTYASLGIGGGLYSLSEGTITGSRFEDNVAKGGDGGGGTFGGIGTGGGAYNDGLLSVWGSSFDGNQAIGGDANVGDVNPGGAFGGGISSGSVSGIRSGELIVERTSFNGNTAVGGDDNLGLYPVPDVHAPGGAGGGGVFVYQGAADLTAVNIARNSAIGGENGPATGGGLYSVSFVGAVDTSLTKVIVSRNIATAGDGATARGGGIANGSFGSFFGGGGTMDATKLIVRGNQAQGGAGGGSGLGGGIFNDTDALLELRLGLIFGNRAVGDTGIGGGVYNLGVFQDALTLIFANYADTSDDDCFGC